MRRRVLLVAVALVAAAGFAAGSASALPLTAGSLGARTATDPCAGSASTTIGTLVTPTTFQARDVAVTMPAGCGSRAVQVTVRNGTTVVASGAGTVDGSGTVTTGTYTAASNLTVALTADGWDVPGTWSYTPHATCALGGGSSASCTAEVTVWTGVKPGGSSEATYLDVTVTTTSTTWVPWTVTFYLGDPYYGQTITRLGNSTLDGYNDGSTSWSTTTYNNNVTRTSACSTLPTLVVRGNTTSTTDRRNFAVVRGDRPREFSLVVNRTDPGYFDVISPGCT